MSQTLEEPRGWEQLLSRNVPASYRDDIALTRLLRGTTLFRHKLMRDSGSFVRWQGITVAQLGYTINLFIGFATASFGFTFYLAKELSLRLDDATKCRFRLALFFLLVSIMLGALCVLCRLADFRKTTRIARLRQELFEVGLTKADVDNRLATRRCVVKCLDKLTWALFYLQLIAFIVSVPFVGIAIWRAHIV